MVSIRICRKGPYCPDRAAKAASVRRYLISNSLGISVSFTLSVRRAQLHALSCLERVAPQGRVWRGPLQNKTGLC